MDVVPGDEMLHAQIADQEHLDEATGETVGKSNGFKLLLANRYLLMIAFLMLFANWVNTNGEYILSKLVTRAAADAVAESVTAEEFASGMLYPAIPRLRDVCHHVSARVMEAASQEGTGDRMSKEEIDSRIADAVWQPEYREYLPG